MNELTAVRTITCPHCWESIEIVVDLSVAGQTYVEDCSVCCHPIELAIDATDQENPEIHVEASE